MEDAWGVRIHNSAMLSRLSTAYNHGAVDIPGESVPRRGWIQTKFTQVYILLFILALLIIATFIVVLIVALRLKDMGNHYDSMSEKANNGFRSISNLFSYPSSSGQQPQQQGARTFQQQPQGNFPSAQGDEGGGGPWQGHPRMEGSIIRKQTNERSHSDSTAQAAPQQGPGASDPFEGIDEDLEMATTPYREDILHNQGAPNPLPRPPSAAPATAPPILPPAEMGAAPQPAALPIKLPPGVDPALFRPENLPNLLRLAAAMHIDLTKLPPEYQALLPKPVNATVVHKTADRDAPGSSTTEERVIQKAPAHTTPNVLLEPEDYDNSEERDIASSTIPPPPSIKLNGVNVVQAEIRNTNTTTEQPKPEPTTVTLTATQQLEFPRLEGIQEEATAAPGSPLMGKSAPHPAPFPSDSSAKPGDWHDPTCGGLGKCKKDDYSTPPLLIISLDGFAHSYLQKKLNPTFDRMAECGATSEFVYPSYPSKTFPNHFTMVTGLWPASHGIVDNAVFDPIISPSLESLKRNMANHSAYFKSEPIWSSYKRVTGKKTACLFWVGCQQDITNYRLDYNLPYIKNMTFTKRMEIIVSWLTLPVGERPGLITAYFPQPDTAAHWQKRDGEVEEALTELDESFDSLFNELRRLEILECVNIVIVSDHGMHKLTKRIYYDEHFPLDGLVPAAGVVGRLHWNGSTQDPSAIMAEFKCSGGTEYRVYSPSSLPPRCHYASSRIVGDVIFEGQPGTAFYPTRQSDPHLTADHGYDYLLPAMRAIFFARGPSIRPLTILPAFQNVEYYHFFEDLLGVVEEKRTNGTRGTMDAALMHPPIRVLQKSILLSECPRIRPHLHTIPCRTCSGTDKRTLDTLLASMGEVTTINPQLGLDSNEDYCLEPFHDVVLAGLRHGRNGTRVMVESLSLTNQRAYANLNVNCAFEHGRFADACDNEEILPGFVRASLLAGNTSAFSGMAKARVPLHSSFVRNFFTPLQNLTHEYLRRYGRLLSFTGTIFDYDTDGEADAEMKSSIPSHIFRVLLSCRHWATDSSCSASSDAFVLAWIIPHVEEDFNCLPPSALLLSYTARVRDVEAATGLRFFADRRIFGEEAARSIRTFIPDKLW